MIILLIALSLTGTEEPPPRPYAQVQAAASIIRGHMSSSKSWNPASQPAQREILKVEEDGRRILIRVTEFE